MSDVDKRPDAAQTNETTVADTNTAETVDNAPDAQLDGNTGEPTDGDMFPRAYVEGLRKESAGYRDRAKAAEDRADNLAKQLHTAMVEATGRLENPDELAFDPEHLADPGKLTAAIDALLEAKPYVAKRRVAGDAGQGNRGTPDTGVSLLALLNGER